jgi:hypothetical protein
MQQTNPVIAENGTKYWYQNGLRHRLNGPAVEYTDGAKYWFQNGLLHRLNGPAAEYANGTKSWYLNDVEYTEDQFRLVAFVNSQVAAQYTYATN